MPVDCLPVAGLELAMRECYGTRIRDNNPMSHPPKVSGAIKVAIQPSTNKSVGVSACVTFVMGHGEGWAAGPDYFPAKPAIGGRSNGYIRSILNAASGLKREIYALSIGGQMLI